MKHDDLIIKYRETFPESAKQIKEWFPNGKDSIRVRLYSGSDFVFTYKNKRDWCYETVESHIHKMIGGVNVVC